MTQYNLSIDFDYERNKIKSSIMCEGNLTDVSSYMLEVYDTNGVLVCTPNNYTLTHSVVNHSSNPNGAGNINTLTTANTECDFGFTAKSNSSPHTQSGRIVDSDIIHGITLLDGAFIQTGLYSPKRHHSLSGVPIIGTRGEFVFQGSIQTVTSKNIITWQTITGALTNCSGQAITNNFVGDLLYIYSGDGVGTYATILGTGSPSNTFILDKNFYNYSGDKFKVFPRRNITEYSGWRDGRVIARYDLDRPIATGLSRYTSELNVMAFSPGLITDLPYQDEDTPGYIPSTSIYAFPKPVNAYAGSIASANAMIVVVRKYQEGAYGWDTDLTTGDVIQYRSQSTPTLVNQVGVVYHVESHIDGDADSIADHICLVFPSGDLSTTSGNTNGVVANVNTFKVMNYPKFNSEFIAVLRSGDTVLATEKVRSPYAELDFSANDYESIYGTVSSTAHFHIGPIKLSNGQVITGNPEVRFNASLYVGDPTQTAPATSWTGYMTSNPDVAEYTSGRYCRHGVFVGNYSQTYLSAEMLTLVYSANIGSAVVSNIASIPVQPSV